MAGAYRSAHLSPLVYFAVQNDYIRRARVTF